VKRVSPVPSRRGRVLLGRLASRRNLGGRFRIPLAADSNFFLSLRNARGCKRRITRCAARGFRNDTRARVVKSTGIIYMLYRVFTEIRIRFQRRFIPRERHSINREYRRMIRANQSARLSRIDKSLIAEEYLRRCIIFHDLHWSRFTSCESVEPRRHPRRMKTLSRREFFRRAFPTCSV